MELLILPLFWLDYSSCITPYPSLFVQSIQHGRGAIFFRVSFLALYAVVNKKWDVNHVMFAYGPQTLQFSFGVRRKMRITSCDTSTPEKQAFDFTSMSIIA